MKSKDPLPLALLSVFLLVLVWSGIKPKDGFTWALEAAPAVCGAVILLVTYSRFRLSDLLYSLVFLHAIILVVGGHYTYAETPLGYWMQDWFGWTRNNYDKIGHFAQGFIPAIVARELLLRKSPLRHGWWLNTTVVSVCLAISAAYELIEWAAALLTGSAADAFLGTQGYVWDTQSDMFLALLGAVAALLLLSRVHDRSMTKLQQSSSRHLAASVRVPPR
jgi:putative membrane protein